MAKKKKEEPVVDNETGSLKVKEKVAKQPDGNETVGNVTKVKETETGGRPTPFEQPISLRMMPANCQFTVAGMDLIVADKKDYTTLKF